MIEGMIRETLNVYYLLDTSDSMSGARIEQLNNCMQELKPELEKAEIDNNVNIKVRVIEFGNNDTASWHVGNAANGVHIENFRWVPLRANGKSTPTAAALEMIADTLNQEYLGRRSLRPVIILLTGSSCTDGLSRYTATCEKVKNKIGGNTIRIAIGVEGANKAELELFASRGKIDEEEDKPFVFETDNAETITKIIGWASVVSIKSSIKTGVGGGNNTQNKI